MEGAIVPEELAPYFQDMQIVMLAVAARSPLATLGNLAEDNRFRGVVICDLDVGNMGPKSWESQRPYVDYYETRWSGLARLKLHLIVAVQSNLALLHERFSLPALIRGNYLDYYVRRRNRFTELHFDWMGNRLLEHARRLYERTRSDYEKAIAPTPEEMEEHYKHVELLVDRLLRKGCRVVFVRMPTSGKLWELDEQFFPKHLYWDRFASQTAAETIHFKEHASLSAFECSEGSHLDYSDSVRFTRALGELLAAPRVGRDIASK
jgi:hypothetical protein